MKESEHLSQDTEIVATLGAGILGYAIGYGATYAVEKLGVDKVGDIKDNVGLASAFLLSGISYAVNADGRAEEYYQSGRTKKAKLKALEASIAHTLNGVVTGIALGHEKGTTGMLLGAAIGGAVGVAAAQEPWQRWKFINKQKFSEQPTDGSHVRPFEIPGHEELLKKTPPIYIADSMQDMKTFREETKKRLISEYAPFNRNFGEPGISMRNGDTAIFALPHVLHLKSLDPRETENGKTPVGTTMRLFDENDDEIKARMPKKAMEHWPFESAFAKDGHLFSPYNWEYYKNQNWTSDVMVLAQIQYQGFGADLKIEDNYWILTLIGRGGGDPQRGNGTDRPLIPIPNFNSDYDESVMDLTNSS